MLGSGRHATACYTFASPMDLDPRFRVDLPIRMLLATRRTIKGRETIRIPSADSGMPLLAGRL